MNVAFDPWIPVVTTAGKQQLASLYEMLTDGGRYADLAVRPHERVALMRLFLCVAHAALDGPKDDAQWCEVPSCLPVAARQYLEKWKDTFELFHPKKPWLQVAGLSKSGGEQKMTDDASDWTPTSKLDFSFATGNKTTLFDHGGMDETRPVATADLVLSILTYQCFSPGGLISQVYWNGKQTTKTSKDAPCAPVSMIHALLRGQNLLDSIHLNLPTHEDISFSYGKRGIGKPVWERPPRQQGNNTSQSANPRGKGDQSVIFSLQACCVLPRGWLDYWHATQTPSRNRRCRCAGSGKLYGGGGA